MGHVPLLATPQLADLSQQIGLASLGASDEDMHKIAAVYWYTIEYGISLENKQYKAVGAALLSSFGEMEHALVKKKAEMRPLDFEDACAQQYPIDDFQSLYYFTPNVQQMMEKVAQFVQSMVQYRYNPETKSVTYIKQ